MKLKHILYLSISAFSAMLLFMNALSSRQAAAQANDLMTCVNEGITQLNLGDQEEAIRHFDCALQFETDQNLAVFVHLKRSQAFSELANFEPTLGDLSQALKLDPLLTEAHIRQSIFYSNYDYVTPMLNQLDEALEADAENPDLHYIRGTIYLHRLDGNKSQAVLDFGQVIELAPDFTWAYLKEIHAYSDLENYELALIDVVKAIAIDPELPQAFSHWAELHVRRGTSEQFLAETRLALADNPDQAAYLYGRGYFFLLEDDFEQAIEDFNQALDRPELLSSYFFRGRTYIELERFDEALQDFTRVIELGPWIPEFYAARGSLFYIRGEYTEAFERLRRLSTNA